MANPRSKTLKIHKTLKSFSLLELVLTLILTGIILTISINFTSVMYNGYFAKKEFRFKSIRLQIVKNILTKRLSLAIKESIKIENNTLIYDSINYTSLLGLFTDGYWHNLFSYDKNLSTKNILYIENIILNDFNQKLKTIEDIELNNLYLKFNNKNTYHKIDCFNCSNLANTIKLTTPNQEINQSDYFSLISSSYVVKLENKTLYLYHNFKQWLQEPYEDKSILIDDVKSFNIREVKANIVMDICLDNGLCENVYLVDVKK